MLRRRFPLPLKADHQVGGCFCCDRRPGNSGVGKSSDANQPTPDDDFSLLIGLGVFVGDHDDLLTDIDDFQVADNRREAALNAGNAPQAASAAQDMANIISAIDGKVIKGEVSGVAAMGIALEAFAMAFSVRSDATAAGSVTETSQTTVDVIDPTRNSLNIEGIIATEFGLSLVQEFALLERKVSVDLPESYRLGLTVRNLITDKFDVDPGAR